MLRLQHVFILVTIFVAQAREAQQTDSALLERLTGSFADVHSYKLVGRKFVFQKLSADPAPELSKLAQRSATPDQVHVLLRTIATSEAGPQVYRVFRRDNWLRCIATPGLGPTCTYVRKGDLSLRVTFQPDHGQVDLMEQPFARAEFLNLQNLNVDLSPWIRFKDNFRAEHLPGGGTKATFQIGPLKRAEMVFDPAGVVRSVNCYSRDEMYLTEFYCGGISSAGHTIPSAFVSISYSGGAIRRCEATFIDEAAINCEVKDDELTSRLDSPLVVVDQRRDHKDAFRLAEHGARWSLDDVVRLANYHGPSAEPVVPPQAPFPRRGYWAPALTISAAAAVLVAIGAIISSRFRRS